MVMIAVVAVAVALGASVEHVAYVRGRASHEVTIDRLGKVVGVTANVSDKVAFFGGTCQRQGHFQSFMSSLTSFITCRLASSPTCFLQCPIMLRSTPHPARYGGCAVWYAVPVCATIQLCIGYTTERDHELFSCSTRPSSVRPTPGMGKTGGTGCAHPDVNA
jgi:hypothetical protein